MSKRLDDISKRAAIALVIAIEGNGKRDPVIMHRLAKTVRKLIQEAYEEGWQEGCADGIETGKDRHWR